MDAWCLGKNGTLKAAATFTLACIIYFFFLALVSAFCWKSTKCHISLYLDYYSHYNFLCIQYSWKCLTFPSLGPYGDWGVQVLDLLLDLSCHSPSVCSEATKIFFVIPIPKEIVDSLLVFSVGWSITNLILMARLHLSSQFFKVLLPWRSCGDVTSPFTVPTCQFFFLGWITSNSTVYTQNVWNKGFMFYHKVKPPFPMEYITWSIFTLVHQWAMYSIFKKFSIIIVIISSSLFVNWVGSGA